MRMPGTSSTSSDAQSAVSEDQLSDLEAYAEKQRQDDRSDELLERTPPFVERGGIYLISVTVIVTLALLYLGRVNELVTASGRLVPDGRSVSVTALEGGVVAEVVAQPGDRLRAGAPILRLDAAPSGRSLNALQRQLRLERSRLDALRADSSLLARVLDDPGAFLRTSGDEPATREVLQLLSDLRNAWTQWQDARTRVNEQLPERRAQTRREIDLTEERLSTLKDNLDAAQDELQTARRTLNETRALADSGYVSQMALRQEASTVRSLEERVSQLQLDRSNQRLRLNELQIKLEDQARTAQQEERAARRAYEQRLETLRQGARDLHTRLREQAATVQAARDKVQGQQQALAQTTVTTPVAGTVAEVRTAAAGELVSTGQKVAVVVPTGEPLVARVQVPNKDIGDVEAGQSVNLKIQAYPHQQFGVVPGRVENVFPNTGASENFTVEVALLQDHLVAQGDTVDLFPGLALQADIIAGKQRLLHLLLQQSGGSGSGSNGDGPSAQRRERRETGPSDGRAGPSVAPLRVGTAAAVAPRVCRLTGDAHQPPRSIPIASLLLRRTVSAPHG